MLKRQELYEYGINVTFPDSNGKHLTSSGVTRGFSLGGKAQLK